MENYIMWTGLLFTVTVIILSYFSGLYFGTIYQKAVYNENKLKIDQKDNDALNNKNKKRQQIAKVTERGKNG